VSEAEIVKVVLGLLGPVSAVITAILILGLVGLGTYLRRYLEQKALQLATREDFHKLQEQVAASTRLVEGIKSELANNDWVKRELHSLRVRKIEELVTLALNCTQDVDAFRDAAIEGKHYGKPRHHDRMLAIAAVYLPELEPLVTAYWQALMIHYGKLGDKAIECAKGNGNAFDHWLTNSNYRDVANALVALKKAAANLLQATANGTVFKQVEQNA
jgi:hypothetical protein